MNTLVQHMTRIRWRVSLALEKANVNATDRRRRLLFRLWDREPDGFDARVDRLVGGFTPEHGYPHARIRRVLYTLHMPRQMWAIKKASMVAALTSRWRQYSGRYEGNESHLIAAYLDNHAEFANDDIGETLEYGSYFMFFWGTFPWTSGEAFYITQDTDQGFFSVTEYDSYDEAVVRWQGIRQQHEFWANGYADISDEAEGAW